MTQGRAEQCGWVFALVFAWKLALLVFTTQPVPANDAFFYDGAVVHWLNGGGYFNPSLAFALPISGGEVFSAYPPLYQAVLLGWMSLFSTSALAAMWLHLILFGLCVLVVWRILRRLNVPALWCNLAALFLFVITFQDRPDSLAHLLGMTAIYAWVRSVEKPTNAAWVWWATGWMVLAFATSLQIGAVYLLWLWLAALATCWARKEAFPLMPLLAVALVPAVLLAAVKFGFPRWWEGFMEHALRTPTVAGWRLPRVDEGIKALRTAPGALAVGAGLVWLAWRGRAAWVARLAQPEMALAASGAIASGAVVGSALFFLAPNFVLVTSYPQPLIVGCFLAAAAGGMVSVRSKRCLIATFLALAALGGIRAVGMTTWGAACAADVGHDRARRLVSDSLERVAPGELVVASSAFLYQTERHRELRACHSDWLAASGHGKTLTALLVERKPARLILTQFDYHRHYVEPVRELQAQPVRVAVVVTNAARLPPPDASRRWQRVVQHVSWAPVIVEFSWQ